MDQINERGQTTTLIHFVFQSEPERIACMPNMTEFHKTQYHPNYQRSNSRRAVTCPACKSTEIYKRRNELTKRERPSGTTTRN